MNPYRLGIYNKCVELESNFPGGIHWGLVLPRGEDWQDYLVLVPEPGSVEVENSGNETVEIRDMRFQIYTSSLETGGTILNLLYRTFRKFSLTLSNGDRIISGYKTSDAAFLDPDRWHDGTEIWLSILAFEFYVQRSVVPV